MSRQPKLGAAVFTSLSSPDPAAVVCQQQITKLMEAIVLRAIGEPAPPDAGERSRMIGHVGTRPWWVGSTVVDVGRVHDELAVAVRLLLPED